ncbi:MAG: arylsulfatase [Oceanipulchritudo sp.]
MTTTRPNILLILNDDMGYSDIGCYGGEIRTTNLDRLAAGGLRFTQFYNTARCCPSRASLLTGLHPHQADVGDMVGNDGVDGYLGDLSPKSATIAEILKESGYRCYMSGKWHVTGRYDSPNENWPRQRGFDEYYGMLCGAASYYAPKTLLRDNTPVEPPDDKDFYFTDAISDEAVAQLERHFSRANPSPFFQYVAYTAPHWPLHAKAEDIQKYGGMYKCGWDAVRERRYARLRELGIIGGEAGLSGRDPTQQAWEDADHKEWEALRMQVYAAQIDCMDQGIGRILGTLEEADQLENTLVIFLADNGGCHEVIGENWGKRLATGWSGQTHTRDGRPVRYGNDPKILPGPEDTYSSYGVAWANASNTPFRKYKSWIHEGGISTPFIVHWPAGIPEQGALRRQPAQLPDVMATILDVTGSPYPERIGERTLLPHEGHSLANAFADRPHGREILTWEHEGNCGLRRGKWKLVREFNKWPKGEGCGYQPWELYDMETDRSELKDLAGAHPEVVEELAALWQEWADRCNVRPFDEILRHRGRWGIQR